MSEKLGRLAKMTSRPRGLQALLLAALVVTFLVMVLGNVNRVTGAGTACPDWPTCFGGWGLPVDQSAQVQVVHRVLALLAGLLMAAGAMVSAEQRKMRRLVTLPLAAGFALLVIESLLGAMVALKGSSAVLSPVHMMLALLTLGLISAASVAGWWPSLPTRISFRTPFARLSVLTAVLVLVLMISGALVTAFDGGEACSGWPLCGGGLPNSALATLQMGHRLLTAAAGVFIGLQFLRAWRGQRTQPFQLVAASGVMVLLVGQGLTGALKVSRGFPADLVGLHAASSAALWALQVGLVAANGLTRRTPEAEAEEARQPLPFRRRAIDFVLLSKPIIVALLLVTTYAGMVVGGQELPGLSVTAWTLLGGALAAGGASALNQYIDREIDGEMQRTARRPLPDGRLTPGEGLAYGLAACLLSFFLLAGFVNLLAALLSLAGMIYYVLLYSVWLKRLTVQNIVIGGGAGAIPPLVGWAAATGGLDVPALVLFAIIFMWTPPHFWALALVRRKDYARVNIPMLPVVRGERATRLQIFIYTLELVALTLLMPVFKITGAIYLVSAGVLGAWLIYSAWSMLKKGGNKTAWRMYRVSSMYLMLLFAALVVDVLI